jgi:tRNA dimethylallyltransferase
MVSKGPRIVVVTGPTCTGKSALALVLAKGFGGEIVNADSMQVYRHFNIGTAKPDPEDRVEVPHHLLDVVDPTEEFNAASFRKMAVDAIDDILSRRRLPIIVGGTGLYLRVLLHGLFEAVGTREVRETLRFQYQSDPKSLYERLCSIDPEYGKKINLRDGVRVVRAMEVFQGTGVTMTEWAKRHGFSERYFDAVKIGLRRGREELYRRIDLRVETMFERGWVDEVRRLLDLGYGEDSRPFAGIGYREILLYMRGAMGYEDMVRTIKRKTRNYAKRQFTWFGRDRDIEWYAYPEETGSIFDRVQGFLNG